MMNVFGFSTVSCCELILAKDSKEEKQGNADGTANGSLRWEWGYWVERGDMRRNRFSCGLSLTRVHLDVEVKVETKRLRYILAV